MLPEFLLRAWLAGIGLAAVAGPLGCFVVWRRMAYFGDTLAHSALLGVTLLFGCTAAFDLRILGWNTRAPITTLSRHLLPLSLASLVLVIPSGVLLFALEATRHLQSGAFMVKLGLILAAAGLAIAFRAGPYKSVSDWDEEIAAPTAARLAAAASLICWTAVLYCAALVGRGP